MTLEIALALTALVFLATLAAIAFWMLSRVLGLVLAHLDPPAPHDGGFADVPEPTLSTGGFADPGRASPGPSVWGDEGSTLLPFSTPLPAFPHFQTVEYSEDEDDVPTTLYRTDDDGELALLADFDD